MDVQNLLNLLIAVVIATSMHAFAEPFNLMNKLRTINDKLNKTKTARPPGPVNTPQKAILASLMMIIVFTGISYLVVGLFDPDLETGLWMAITLLIVQELINTKRVDELHTELAAIIKKVKN